MEIAVPNAMRAAASTSRDLQNGVEIAVPNAMRAAASTDLPGLCKWSGISCAKCNVRRPEYLPPETLKMEWE